MNDVLTDNSYKNVPVFAIKFMSVRFSCKSGANGESNTCEEKKLSENVSTLGTLTNFCSTLK